jgi:hypothetical protein
MCVSIVVVHRNTLACHPYAHEERIHEKSIHEVCINEERNQSITMKRVVPTKSVSNGVGRHAQTFHTHEERIHEECIPRTDHPLPIRTVDVRIRWGGPSK